MDGGAQPGARHLLLRRRHECQGRRIAGLLSLEYLIDSNTCVLGTRDECLLDTCKKYEAAGIDLLLCLVNPYKIPHDG